MSCAGIHAEWVPEVDAAAGGPVTANQTSLPVTFEGVHKTSYQAETCTVRFTVVPGSLAFAFRVKV